MKAISVTISTILLVNSVYSSIIRVPIESTSRRITYYYPSDSKASVEFETPSEEVGKLMFAEKSSERAKVEDLRKELSRIKLENFLNWQYFGYISFGSNNETFTMIFDTGSSWIWILGEGCNSCESTMKIFNCRASSSCEKVDKTLGSQKIDSNSKNDTFRSGNYTLNHSEIGNRLKKLPKHAERDEWHHNMLFQKISKNNTDKGLSVSVVYGKGEIKGEIYTENLRLNSALEVKNQSFLLVYDIKDLQNHQFDGVCGLGFRKLEGGGLSLLQNLKEQGKINRTVFSFFLNNELQGQVNEKDFKSELILGGFDEKYVDGKISYFNLSHASHWAIEASRSFVGDRLLSKEAANAIIDSGTSLILMPKRDFSEIMKHLKTNLKKICVSQGLLVICACPDGNYNDFPIIALEVEGKMNITIKPEFYIRREKHRCSLLIGIAESLADQTQHWVLGDVFMRQYYTIFDLEDRKIGLASVPKLQAEESKFYFDVFIVLGGMGVAIITGIIFIGLIRWFSGLGKLKDSEKNPFLKT